MKVAIVLNTSWNIYNFRKGLVESFLEKDMEVFTIAPVDKFTPKLTEMGCKHLPVKMDSRGANPIKDFLLIIELLSIYRKIKPDVILHFTIKPNIYGTIAAGLLGIPVINNVCGLGTMFLKDNLVSRIAITLYRIAFRIPRKIFFQNTDDRELFLKKQIAKKSVTDLLPGSGIDLNEFFPDRSPKNEHFTFLLISRLIYDKGILEFVDAINKLKEQGIDAKFQVLGAVDEKHKRGIPRHIVDDWIEKDVIEYLGTTEDVKYFIRQADCVVLPSYREGTPKTLLEAASMGIPIVATDVPGCRNVVEDGYNGFLCNVKDSKDLADKMHKIWSLDTEEREVLGNNSRKKVEEQFDIKLVIDKYHSTMSSL
jgi:glycosyltransferase involved in cell wall biosynthesis